MQTSINRKDKLSAIIHNIGILASGDITNPILKADSLLIKEGIIESIGSCEKIKNASVDLDIDIRGMTLCPGLIDTHTHPNIGDWTPRLKILGWMETELHSGVTTIISQGEAIFPGRPQDASGVKALAILARKVYQNYHPGGLKAHCGALLLEDGLTEHDIEELAQEGVWLFAEIGFGGLKDFNKINTLVKAAKKHGFKIPVHFGPESTVGASGLDNDNIINLNPDIIAHFNGGPTACSFSEMKKMIEHSTAYIELISNGNPRALNYAAKLLKKREELGRIILGTDTPTGTGGIHPLGIIRLVAELSSVNCIAPEIALCMATGNSARAFGLNTGMIKPGKEADFLVMDAPANSQGRNALEALKFGDNPNMGMIMIDGEIISRTMRRAFNTNKKVLVNGKEDTRRVIDEMFL